jgi:hypothetical protein
MFLTIIVITSLLSLRIGNAELFGKEDNDFFNNDMYMKTNKYEKSEKHQYIGNINENDIIKGIIISD